MTEQEIKKHETVCRSLMEWTGNELLHEQDTIEHLIVPILRSVGWDVDCVAKPQLVRGNRDNKSDHRSFDLNIYKDIDGLNLTIAIECKKITVDFLSPECEVESLLYGNSDVCERSKDKSKKKDVSDLPGLGQLLRDYLDEMKFGRVKSGAKVLCGQTVAVWTNGRTWVLVRGEEDSADFKCSPDRISVVPVELVSYVAPCSQLRFALAVFTLFDQAGNFDKNEYDQLAEELNPSGFLNAPFGGQ